MGEKFKTRIIEEFHMEVDFTVEKANLSGLVANLLKLGAENFEIRMRPKYPVGEEVAQEQQ